VLREGASSNPWNKLNRKGELRSGFAFHASTAAGQGPFLAVFLAGSDNEHHERVTAAALEAGTRREKLRSRFRPASEIAHKGDTEDVVAKIDPCLVVTGASALREILFTCDTVTSPGIAGRGA
jgi:hypothetical protein